MDFNVKDFLLCGAVVALDQHNVLVGYGPRRWLSQPVKNSFFFPTFFLLEPKQWFTHEIVVKLPTQELLHLLNMHSPLSHSIKRLWQGTTEHSFFATMDDLMKKFESKQLLKAVPYIRQYSDEGVDKQQLLLSLINALTYAQKSPLYVYGFWEKDSGMLGATPEVLFRLSSNDTLTTMACAGTRMRGEDESLILDDPKERHEHQLVIDDITQALSRYGQITCAPTAVVPYHKLVHLVTPISVALKENATFETIVRAMHPTAALGALPRDAGEEWLFDYANTQEYRDRFGAPAGCIVDDEALCLVAIRNMQWYQQRVNIYAGCGVVPTSTAEREWNELQLKLNSIKELLAL